jgi:site-specific DNA recombinase
VLFGSKSYAQLLADITAGKVQMVHSFDRWSRNVMVTLQSFRALAEAHATFLSLSEHLDDSTPEGRLQLTIFAAFAAYFSDVLAIHTSKGKQERAAQGLCNGDLPFGYRSTGPKTPPEQDPVTFAGLRLMGMLRREGLSMDRIAEEMNAAGYRTGRKRFGPRLFPGDTVRAMLRNEFSAAYAPGDERGTILSHGKLYRGQHLAAFTREEWEAMQRVRAARAQRPCTEKEPASPPAFAGTLVCAFCERKLRSRKGTSHDY